MLRQVLTTVFSNEEDHVLGHHDLIGVLHLLQSRLDLRPRELHTLVRVDLVSELTDGQTLGVAGREHLHQRGPEL